MYCKIARKFIFMTRIPRECILSLSNIERIPNLSPSEPTYMSYGPTTPTSPEGLADEWMNNSLTLMADAFYVRHLMALGFRGLGENCHRANESRDIVFVRCAQRDVQINLRVFLGWMQIVHRGRIERSAARRVESGHTRRLMQGIIDKWLVMIRVNHMAHKKSQKSLRAAILFWKQISHKFGPSRRKLQSKYHFRLVSRSLRSWHGAYGDQYLVHVNQEEMYRKLVLKKVLERFREYRKDRLKKLKGDQLRQRLLCGSVCRLWRNVAVDGRRGRERVLSKVSVGPYMIYKLMVGVCDTVDVHVPIREASCDALHASVLHACLSKWRMVATEEACGRRQKDMVVKKRCFGTWKMIVRDTHELVNKVREFSVKLIGRRDEKLIINCWKIWRKRESQRHYFRQELAGLVNRSSLFVEGVCFAGWVRTARKETELAKKSQMMRNDRSRKMFSYFFSIVKGSVRVRAEGEMVDLFRRKIGFRVVVKVLKQGVNYARRKIEMEKKGEFLSMAVCFSRWVLAKNMRRSVVGFVERIVVRRAGESMGKHFRGWKILWKSGNLNKRKWNGNSTELIRNVFETFKKNHFIHQRNRFLADMVHTHLVRASLGRLRRYSESRTCFAKYFSKRKLLSAWTQWVHAQLVTESMRVVGRMHAKCLLNEGMHALVRNSVMGRIGELEKVEQIVVGRIKKIVKEWNLLMKFQVTRRSVRQGRDRELGRFKVLEASLNTWRHTHRVKKFIAQKFEKKSLKLKQYVFSRSSPWRVAVNGKRLTERCINRRTHNSWTTWRDASEIINEKMGRLQYLASLVVTSQTRKVLSQWYRFVAHQRLVKASLFFGWRGFVGRAVALRQAFMSAFSIRVGNQIEKFWDAWRLRYSQREILRTRILQLTMDHVRRKAEGVLLAFARERDLGMKRRLVETKTFRKFQISLIEKWIKGTVTVISIRELLGGGKVERMRNRVMLHVGFNEWLKFGKIAKFEDQRKARIGQFAIEHDTDTKHQFFSSWRDFVKEESIMRDKINLFRKFYGIQKLKFSAHARKETLTMELVADELSLQFQTDRISNCIERAVFGWRELVQREKFLKETSFLVQAVNETRLLGVYMHEWKYQWEMAVYTGQLQEHEKELVGRMNFKTKTNVFNQLILMFLESTEVVKLGIDFHHFMMKRRVINGFKDNQTMANKSHVLADMVLNKRLKSSMRAMKTETQLSKNERTYFLKHNTRHALTQLRIFAKFKRDTKSNMNTPRTPYHEQRKKSIRIESPVVTPPPPSYRERRLKRDEQRA